MRQGRVVRKPVNTNPGLKVNQSINSSCIKILLTSNSSSISRLVKLKTEGQQYKEKTSPTSYKTEIKILANPGLA